MYTPNYYNPAYIPQVPVMGPTQQLIMQNENLPTNGLIWVHGVDEANKYPISKNSTVALWDIDSQTIYLKTTNNLGMPTMYILDWVDRQQQKIPETKTEKGNVPTVEYVTREEFSDVVKRLDKLSNKINNKPKQEKEENINA